MLPLVLRMKLHGLTGSLDASEATAITDVASGMILHRLRSIKTLGYLPAPSLECPDGGARWIEDWLPYWPQTWLGTAD